jgi:hypothetical protein
MNTKMPEWGKPAAWGGVIGAILVVVIGFSTGWVVTSGSAQAMADQQEEQAIIAALTPICVAQFRSQSSDVRTKQLAALESESSWQRGNYVEKQGWATMPGGKEPIDEVADACATELLKRATK